MLPEDFITKNIITILASEGVPDEVAQGLGEISTAAAQEASQ